MARQSPSCSRVAGAMAGRIELILGPMFAGKSTELMRRVKRHRIAGRRCIVLKHATDTRYSDSGIATHERDTMPAIPCEALSHVQHVVDEYDCVAIDEGQFFPDIHAFCDFNANHGRVVIVASLDSTFDRQPFGYAHNLVSIADSVTKLSAVCMVCGADAIFSQRIDANDTRTTVVGGAEAYRAVCRACYNVRVE